MPLPPFAFPLALLADQLERIEGATYACLAVFALACMIGTVRHIFGDEPEPQPCRCRGAMGIHGDPAANLVITTEDPSVNESLI